MKAIWLSNMPQYLEQVFEPSTREPLAQEAGLVPEPLTKADVLARPEEFRETEYIFSTWGMPAFTEDEIRSIFPSLRCVFYGAGSVQGFAREFLSCGVRVFSAWQANAIPVAEYALAQILLANKGFLTAARLMSGGRTAESKDWMNTHEGNYDRTVGLIGVGQVARALIKLLKPFHLNIKAYDPYLPQEAAEALGVEKCSLEALFATCHVVSNHLPNNASTQGMLRYGHFSAMLPHATFLNTGRGAQVIEDDLVRVLEERPDLTAVLDVTWPEPPEPGHGFYRLPNCVLTPHMAGSSGWEVRRMGVFMLEEFRRYAAGEACLYEVSLKMLETMA